MISRTNPNERVTATNTITSVVKRHPLVTFFVLAVLAYSMLHKSIVPRSVIVVAKA
jgi:hypothetical protein